MFDVGNDDGSGSRFREAEQGQIIRFCTPTCEQATVTRHPLSLSTARYQNTIARLLEDFAGRAAVGMLAAGVCKTCMQQLGNMVGNLRFHLGRGVVIEVNQPKDSRWLGERIEFGVAVGLKRV
jgi:hypothetical protein